MRSERELPYAGITAIHIDLVEQAVEFEDKHGTLARVDFGDIPIQFTGAQELGIAPPDFVPTTARDSNTVEAD